MKLFFDIESGELVTSAQLFHEWQMNVANGNTEPCTFPEYIQNCMTSHNGTLEEI